jgi:hypothetical protein
MHLMIASRNWEGGYFSAHGDMDDEEEWKDEDKIAQVYGPLNIQGR